MTIRDIAIKNLLRRKAKAAFILAGLVIGVATVVAVISFAETMTHDINSKLEKYGANILIVPRTDNLTLSYGGMTLGGVSFDMQAIAEKDLDRIQTIKNARNVAAVGPIVLGTVKIHDRTVLLAGVNFESARVLKPWWKLNGRPPAQNGMVMGAETARVLKLGRGDHLAVNDRPMQVSAVLAPTGSQDDQIVFTRLDTAQQLLGKTHQVSMVEVAALCNACPIDAMVEQIASVLPGAKVMAIQQVVKGRMQALSHFKKFSYGLSVVVVFIGGLVVLVTLMGSVKERTEEIGIFRAIGFRRRHVMRIIFLETGIVSSLAGVIGFLLGTGGIYAGLKLFGSAAAAAVRPDPILAAGAIVMAMVVGLAASAYPALMAARMDPNQALKTI